MMVHTLPLLAWWCSARGLPWQWRWQAFPGIWLFVLALELSYLIPVLVHHHRTSGEASAGTRRRALLYTAGVLVVWAFADWPIGLLGAAYLASAHMLEYLAFTLAAPPLMLLGLPPWLPERLLQPARVRAIARRVTHPVAALLVVDAVLVLTHLPTITDPLLKLQVGNMLIDLLWLASGLLLWWPVVGPLPDFNHLSEPLAIVYLFAQSLIPAIPASILTFSPFPLYSVYELAPRVWVGVPATTDQQMAGLTMKLVGGLVLLTGIGVKFFRWWAREERGEREAYEALELRWEEVQGELVELGLITADEPLR